MSKIVKDKLLFELSEIVMKLQAWIEDRDGLSSRPIAHLTWSCDYYQIKIGNCVVFDSEQDEELSFQECVRQYLEGISELLPFAQELPEMKQINKMLEQHSCDYKQGHPLVKEPCAICNYVKDKLCSS